MGDFFLSLNDAAHFLFKVLRQYSETGFAGRLNGFLCQFQMEMDYACSSSSLTLIAIAIPGDTSCSSNSFLTSL